MLEAARDLRYLLKRGYVRERILDIVVERYRLDKKARSALYRCIHPPKMAEDIRSRFTLRCKELAVDLLNSLITILAMIEGDYVFVCDDCLVRDVRGSKIRSSDRPFVDKALHILVETIDYCKPQEVIVVCERQISYSALYAKKACNLIENILDAKCRAIVLDKVDKFLIDACSDQRVVSSTDMVVLRECPRIYPLTYIALTTLGIKPTLDFAKSFGTNCYKMVFGSVGY